MEKIYELQQYKSEMEVSVTELTIQNAVANGLNQQDKEKLKREYKELGISEEFIEPIDERNLYMAKRIVDGYKFERNLTKQEERAIIQSILNSTLLTKNKPCFLITLARNLEKIELNEREIYGTIINLGVNGSVIEIGDYGYNKLLSNKTKVLELSQYKDRIEMSVSDMTIRAAVESQLSEQEKEDLERQYGELGISEEFINSIDIRNLYSAKKIVDGYNFGRKLTKQEERAVIQSILDNKLLKRESIYLSKLENNLEKIGFTEQEIYGTIINLGINEKIVQEPGYGYQNLINNTEKVFELSQYKSKIDTSVSDMTIQTAETNQLNEQDLKKLKSECKDLGLDEDFIDSINEKNLYMAKKIVDGYKFDRELSEEEKRLILQSILRPKMLGKNRQSYITTLAKNLERIGLAEQEIYGTIINLSVNGNVVQDKGYRYLNLLNSPTKVLKLLQNKDEIETKVSETTIEKLTSKAETIMKKTVKTVQKNGQMSSFEETIRELSELQQLEEKELEEVVTNRG